ncbi:MAG: hypothetical protein ACK4HW_08660 [Roseinatronobacter sp.]
MTSKPKIEWRGPMYHGTERLHHYIEAKTLLGQIMKKGTPTPEQFAGWLSMKAQFFDGIEPGIPPACRRADAYRRDLAELGLPEVEMKGASLHRRWLTEPGLSRPEAERRMTGTIYVCVGSSFGAAEIKKHLTDAGMPYSTSSFQFFDQPTEMAYLRQLRHRGDCIYEAMQTFARMTECCEQIVEASS